jgi:protein transport protein SEC13
MSSGSYDVAKYGTLHDAQYDFFAQRVAMASSDTVVRIFNVGTCELLTELRGHRSPVLGVSWAQGTRFASTLASGSADGQVIIWREKPGAPMQRVHDLNVTSAANAVTFGPAEYGLILVVAGNDDLGVVTVVTRREIAASPMLPTGEQWQVKAFPAHEGGVVAVSWAPSTSAATLASGPSVGRAANLAPRRFVTGGADGEVCIWQGDEKTDHWTKECSLSDASIPKSIIRDVAWRPNVGIPSSLIATCSEDGTVALWAQDILGRPWRLHCHWKVDGDARRLAWSKAGALLGVSVGEEGTSLYHETKEGPWTLTTTFED